MGWESLLAKESKQTLPWAGGRCVWDSSRTWLIEGNLPPEYGWYRFAVSGGRRAKVAEPAEPNPEFDSGDKLTRGYLVGDRLIPDFARVVLDPKLLIEQTVPVLLVEPGMPRFTRAVVAHLRNLQFIYLRQEFPQGPEEEVTAAYQDRLESVDHIKGVTPPLDLAFRWLTLQRKLAEERAAERERRRVVEQKKREAEARLQEAMKNIGTGAGRRVLAKQDFQAAAKAALALSGAELLDTRPSERRGEMVIQYRLQHRRLECVVERGTLQIIDAGICLTDHDTGEKGDKLLSLENLPPVVLEAMREHKLVVWRHAPGDIDADHRDWRDADDED